MFFGYRMFCLENTLVNLPFLQQQKTICFLQREVEKNHVFQFLVGTCLFDFNLRGSVRGDEAKATLM